MGLVCNMANMKRIILLLFSVITINTTYAQDIIVLYDTTEIESKIIDIGKSVIVYKDWDGQDNSIRTIEKSKVFYVKKQDGSKDNLSNEITIPPSTTSNSSKIHNKHFDKDKQVHFQCYVYAGMVSYKSPILFEAGPIVDLSLGVDVLKRFYIGTMFGLHTLFANTYVSNIKVSISEFISPIAPINFKFHIVNNEIMNPFVDFSIGYSIFNSQYSTVGTYMAVTDGGLFMQAGLGYNADKFSFTVGWTGIKINTFAHMWHVKFGAKF